MDSLAFSWAGETCWLVPPVSLVKNVIPHVCFCQCRGILVVPYWPSAPFWPFLVERKGGFRSFVLDPLFVENGKDVYLHGKVIVPFSAQRILVSQCFFFCLTELCSTVSSKICL